MTHAAPRVSAPRLVILGRQGSGKGTQATRLAAHYGLVHLSTGDALRAAVRDRSPLGRAVESLLATGDLVPDEVVVEVVRAAIDRPETRRRGWILDGFPRTLTQAEQFDAEVGTGVIDAVISLQVDPDTARTRMAARRVCTACGHVTFARAGTVALPCPTCGGECRRRADDEPVAIERRLARYDAEAHPIEAHYRAQATLLAVDAGAGVDDVFAAIRARLRPVLWGEGMAVG